MVQRLVLLGIAVLFSLGDGEVPDKGTCLAPAIKAEKIAGEDLLPTGSIFVSGKEEATEGAEAAASAIWPSQLESCRDSPSDSSSSRHDLVLQALRSSEQSELREIQSRSKTRKYKGETPEEAKEEDTWQVFQEKVPWIPSTPSRTSTFQAETVPGVKDKEMPLPPQPLLPPPPPALNPVAEVMTTEEVKLLEHLRGLRDMKLQLSEDMQQKLQLLTDKEQQVASAKALSHGHLNRLNKAKNQAAAAAKKIKDLDAEWQAFMKRTTERVRQHALMFQDCRASLLETYNQRLQDLQMLKKEVTAATMSLVDQPQLEHDVEETPLVADHMEELNVTFLQGSIVEEMPIDLTEGPMEDVEGGEHMEEGRSERKSSPPALQPFRSAASPTTVAKSHLKSKPEKGIKDKDAKAKEDK